MEASLQINSSRIHIVRFYKKATYSYLAPIGLVLLGFLFDFFLLLALFTILPCSITGLFFTIKGLKLSKEQGDLEKKDVGYANIFLGIILFVVGLLGAAFAYVTVSG